MPDVQHASTFIPTSFIPHTQQQQQHKNSTIPFTLHTNTTHKTETYGFGLAFFLLVACQNMCELSRNDLCCRRRRCRCCLHRYCALCPQSACPFIPPSWSVVCACVFAVGLSAARCRGDSAVDHRGAHTERAAKSVHSSLHFTPYSAHSVSLPLSHSVVGSCDVHPRIHIL